LATPRPDDAIWLVAEVEGDIVGWIYARILAPMDNSHFQLLRELAKSRVFIDALGVQRPFQRRGIGAQLVHAVEDWARDKGAEHASLDTYVDSPVSVPFYKALGYYPKSLVFQKRLR
jgi:GNAT superfamily N-acetyltransferase